MAKAINVFCCGTGEHRDNRGNIVIEAYRAVQSTGGTCHIIDGVGQKVHRVGKNLRAFKKWNKYERDYLKLDNKHKNATSGLTGYGVYDNIRNGYVWVYENMGYDTTDVNLVGWSRGAVECIMLAHSIYRTFNSVRINIFAIDPVAGGILGVCNPYLAPQGKFDKTGITGKPNRLAAGVNEYYGVVAEQISGAVKKPVFNSVRPKFGKNNAYGNQARYDVHMPGDHSGVAKISGPIGEIVASECGKFLHRHGAKNHGLTKLGDARTMERYADVRLNFDKKYAKSYKVRHTNRQDKHVTTKTIKVPKSTIGWARGRKNEENFYLKHPFFINNHHADVCAEALNDDQLLIALRTETPLNSRQRAKIRNQFPRTRLALIEVGLWRDE